MTDPSYENEPFEYGNVPTAAELPVRLNPDGTDPWIVGVRP